MPFLRQSRWLAPRPANRAHRQRARHLDREPPCQDNSVAAAICGGRAGLSGARSGLAHTWLDLIAARQPQGICFENVPGISPWLAEITRRLGQLGYRVRRPERSSADVDAPHLRRRSVDCCRPWWPGTSEAPAPRTTRAVLRPAVSPSRKRLRHQCRQNSPGG